MKNKIRSLLLTGAALALELSGFAQSRVIPLAEAIRLGIGSSSRLQVDSALILQSEAQYDEAWQHALPDASVSAQQLFLNSPTVNLQTTTRQSSDTSTTQRSSTPQVSRVFFLNASASLPLFAGGQIRYGRERAKLLREAACLSAGSDRSAVAYNVAQAYNNLSKATDAIAVIEEDLRAARARDSNFLQLENNGAIPRNDRLKAALQTSNIELQLLEAQSNYSLAQSTLNLLLGLLETTDIQIDRAYTSIQIPAGSYEDYLQQAVANRQDLKALSLQEKAATFGIKSAKAGYLPTLAATGGYVYLDVPNLITVTNALNGGVALKYSLSSLWKTKSAIHLAQAQRMQVEANSRALSDAIRLQVNQDYQMQVLAQRKIAVYQKAEQQAEENARIIRNKRDNGLATITELLDADAALLSAKLNVSYAQSDAALAYYKLLQTTGFVPGENPSR